MSVKRKKAVRYAAAAAAFLLVLELSLRLGGFVMLSASVRKNAIAAEDESAFRVLTVGESTTADLFGSESWPRQLERKLREQGLRVRVYNAGVIGTMSPFIVKHLPEYLEKYRPHAVIAMMGVNDTFGLTLSDESGVHAWWSELRVVKLSDWILAGIKGQYNRCRFSDRNPRHEEKFAKALEISPAQPVEEIERKLREIYSGDEEVALALLRIVQNMRRDFGDPNARDGSLPLTLRAFELEPRNTKIAFWVLHNNTIPVRECLTVSEELLRCAGYLPDNVLSGIAFCAVRSSRQESLAPALPQGIALLKSHQSFTADQHRRMHGILKEAGVAFVDMQYPTRSLSALRGYFSTWGDELDPQFQDIVFVSNEDNFAEALKRRRYDEIFTDRFRQDWGHATTYGNSLIAERLVPVISKLYGASNVSRR